MSPTSPDPKLSEKKASAGPADIRKNWRSVLTHTHMEHGGLPPPQNYVNLVRWASERGIAAMGVGSPFTQKTASAYSRYEEAGRDLYYGPAFDVQTVKHPEEAASVIHELNALSKGDTLFYLDNETPKARYGHMWWFGWNHDFPEWHDYDQPFDRWMCREQAAEDSQPEPMPYERRPYMEIVATQRKKGALGIWAHPTSWWRTDAGAFVTNIASEMPAHLVADGFIDGLVIMGYDAYRPYYLSLWFHLLDLGYRVTGLAESDIGLSSQHLWEEKTYLTHVFAPHGLKASSDIVQQMKGGCLYSSSGPHVEITVDGKHMGSIAETREGQKHDICIKAWPRTGGGQLGVVELIGKGGEVLWSEKNPPGGEFHIEVPGGQSAGYLIARVFGEGEDATMAQQTVDQFAITNPVYLHPRGHSFPSPATSEVNIRFDSCNPYMGGELLLETACGELIEHHEVRSTDLNLTCPASARITLKAEGQEPVTHYLINANPKVIQLQQYLYRGQFLRDWPGLHPGDVPAEAFQIEQFARAMEDVRLEFGKV